MDKLRKRILLDLFASPMTVIPTTLGASLLFVSGIFGGNTAYFGILGILVGFGALLTNFVWNLEGIVQKASRRWVEEQQQKKADALDALDARLTKTDDPNDERLLRKLRSVYDNFCEDLKKDDPQSLPADMLSTVDDLFESCIKKMEQSLKLWQLTQAATGELRAKFHTNREEVLQDVQQSVFDLSNTISEVQALQLRTSDVDLERIRDRMKTQLQVAKATEERLARLDQTKQMDRFREYEDMAD